MFLYNLVKYACKIAFKVVYFTKYKKPQDELNGKGCLVCSNHMSAIDPIFLMGGSKRRILFYAKAELWNVPFLKLFMDMFAIPVNRKVADLSSIHAVINAVDNGNAVGIFPQGTRRRGVDPKDTIIKNGVSLIAHKSKCDIIPAYVHTKEYKLKIFRKVTVIYGKPIKYEDLNIVEGSTDELRNAADYIWSKICELKPSEDA